MSLIVTIPHHPRVLKATEARLERIYEAAKLGLKGDSLALAAGMTPQEFRTLNEFDPNVDLAAKKGKADAELEMATVVATAAREGDSKSAQFMLQHVHGWAAKDQAAAFGAGGITINITSVKPSVETFVDREPIDG